MRPTSSRWTSKPPFGTLIDPDHPLAQRLGAFWVFSEGAGTKVWDASGNGNHGTFGVTTNPQWVSGAYTGSALSFNGTADGIHVPPSASIKPTSSLTVGLILTPQQFGSGGFYPDLISLDDSNSTVGYGLYLSGATSGALYFGVGTGNVDNAGSMSLGTRYHICGTWDGATGRLYLNGAQVGSFSVSSVSYSGVASYMGIGNDPYGLTQQWVKGIYECAWVSDRCWSASEIVAHTKEPFSLFLPERRRRRNTTTVITSFTITLGAKGVSASTSLNASQTLNGTLAASAQAAKAALNANGFLPTTLAASAQAVAASLNASGFLNGTLGASAQAASASLNANDFLGATIGASAQTASVALNASGFLYATLGASAQTATSGFNLQNTNPPLIVTLAASSGAAQVSFVASQTLGASPGPRAQSATVAFNVNNGAGITLQAAAQVASASFGATGSLGATLAAQGASASVSLSSTGFLLATLQAASQSPSVALGATGSLNATLSASSARAAASFNATGFLGATLAAAAQPATVSLSSSGFLGLTLQATAQPASASLAGQWTGAGLFNTITLQASAQPGSVSLTASGLFPDLLTAVVQTLLATPAVTGQLGAASNVFFQIADVSATRPFVRIFGYSEVLPGLTVEDEPVPFAVIVDADNLSEARAIGTAVKQALDTPAINPSSTLTTPLAFIGGTVSGVMRNKSKPRRVPGLHRGNGNLIYRETIEYQFWITPNQ